MTASSRRRSSGDAKSALARPNDDISQVMNKKRSSKGKKLQTRHSSANPVSAGVVDLSTELQGMSHVKRRGSASPENFKDQHMSKPRVSIDESLT